ncbi:VOC family protein [Fructilactobacillus myrtifloralis]|uniref:VOC family protein n=1 Tax=Fructilactobacillus myrtifloralis TaxID=2940301 RepID=A0ABY5BQF0_9LACO|nr:VOC family protein [Fructilactobacillus myrtifloralis]USS85411.1 VOC family protein [Fructilactobacillus myrtifloralis]
MALDNYFTGIQHVGIPATDLDETVAFYEKLGFEKAGEFLYQGNRCAFMKYGNLLIETWEGDETAKVDGAINHISLNTTDAAAALQEAKQMDLNLIDTEIQTRPFWDKGIKFFNIYGPNHEKIEFCEIVK